MRPFMPCLTAAIALGALEGCAPDLPAPEPAAIAPVWGWNGEPTDVRIEGSGFYPRVQVGGAEDVEVDRQFRAWLKGPQQVELEAVSFQDYDELSARVPAGLLPGRYSLVVVGPGEETGRLDDAFTVTDTRADHLELTASDTSWSVHSLARLDIQLADREGSLVPEPIEISVIIRGIEQPELIRFEESLQDQQLLVDLDEDVIGVQGRLEPDGHGYVVLTSTVPADLWLEVAPVDPDSVVAGGQQFLAFDPATATRVLIEPADGSLVRTAGEPFDLQLTLVDDYGNVAYDSSAGITLFETCGAPAGRYTGETTILGTRVVEDVVLMGGTEDGGAATCVSNTIAALGNSSGSAIAGESDPFTVLPGNVSSYEVEAWPGTVEAGAQPVFVLVEAVDGLGNRVLDHDAGLSLSDSAGGLSGEDAVSCSGFGSGVNTCIAWPVRAGTGVVISAIDDEGRRGDGPGITVNPGPPTRLVAVGPSGTVAAGAAFVLDLRTEDSWGNGVRLDIGAADAPTFEDGTGPVSCSWQGSVAPYGTERFRCMATAAEPNKQISIGIPSQGLSAITGPFKLTNGALARVDLSLAGVTRLVAGDTASLSAVAYDAWDNPYVVQATNQVGIWDLSGDVAGTTIVLDGAGHGSTSLLFTTAWVDNRVEARAGTTTLGSSAYFSVDAGDPAELSVDVERPWAWVGDELEVIVTALDAHGNPTPSYSAEVQLESLGGAGEPILVTGFSKGTATTTFVFDQPLLQDRLLADDGELAGESDLLDAVESCTGGPSAFLAVGGTTELVLCRTAGSTPSTALSTAASTPGDAAVVATHFAPEPDRWSRVPGTSTTSSWADTGAFRVQALVVDGSACADLAEAMVWVAENDGEAAGPVEVSTSVNELVAGSSSRGVATVQVSAVDCAGDPAVGATLGVRADLGAISSGSTLISSSGDGLVFTLDSNGEAAITWSVASESHAADATVHVGRAGGEAYGSAEVDVTGDSALPFVVDAAPAGTTDELFSDVVVTFSEVMRPTTVDATTVAITDPTGGTTAGESRTFSSDGTELTIRLADMGDAAIGAWTLALSANIRDIAGNRLDGAFVGAAMPFTLQFGAVVDSAPDMTTCSASATLFRPDGDHGSGSAADRVDLTLTASSAPRWWEIKVHDENGTLTYLDREPASTATGATSWTGRGRDGRVVDNGRYTLTVTGLDAHWNAGASCSTEVAVANELRAPE